jgi:hypothetical protein
MKQEILELIRVVLTFISILQYQIRHWTNTHRLQEVSELPDEILLTCKNNL